MSGLYIERRGRGDVPLVMLHGWAMHGGILAPLADALDARFDMYIVDLPGHGRSRDAALPLDPATCAAALVERVPPAMWLGWSMGGLFAMIAALDYPDRVRALIPVSATPCFVRTPDWPHGNDVAMVRKLAADLDADYKATVDRFIALEAMGSADPRAETRRLLADAYARGEPDPRVLREGLRLLETTDLRPRLGDLRPPSLWIAGQRDRIVHPEAMRWSAQAARGDVETINAGHAPFIGHADELARAITHFTEAHA
ncbi:pimeloyl-ACP methyl ester esterase BioH [Luteibacter sahnii]|uniref:pimeloyl-ACP methyl ester esterase BioH n=1 Tax=Luteibacter sahnii TaxID=3021977 RepID=UPI002A6B4ED2|nr:pimeloyl-ACP methyl ester esterase BioH [Luteibacter sp. PPL193]MDY1548941.1 pimeloyl-ACP methyl ester esterase BioH [Luteibacter sp. PPL193]